MVTEKAPDGREFTLANGNTVRSIEELLNFLRESTDKDYEHHVSEERNDFAIWIEDVHDREDLADKLDQASSRKEAINILHEAVKKYYQTAMKEVSRDLKGDETPGKEIKPRHGEFMMEEFIYGLIFGFVLGILAYAILANLI